MFTSKMYPNQKFLIRMMRLSRLLVQLYVAQICTFSTVSFRQWSVKSAFLLGAERVIAIDHIPARLKMAQVACGAEVLNFEQVNVLESLNEMTGGRGPDACVDAVGLEDHGCGLASYYDRFKMGVGLATDRPQVLRQCLLACRKGGTVSIPGVYGGLLDKMPFGAAFAKGLTLRMGQTHVQAYLPKLL